MIKFNDLVLLAPGGACGSFVSTIFGYYLGVLPKLDNVINIKTGDCHNSPGKIILRHFPDQILSAELTKTLVCIRPTKSNAYLIAKMMYHKHFISWINTHPEIAVAQWPELDGHLDDNPDKKFELFMSNIDTKIDIDTWVSIDQSQVDLLIEFDDVLGVGQKDLNEIISNFLNTSRLPEVDVFIEQYRAVNKQYI